MTKNRDELFNEVVERVSLMLGVREEFLFRQRRKNTIAVVGKEIIIAVLYPMGLWSYPELAERFGTTNHSTIITAHQRALAKMKTNGIVGHKGKVPVTMADVVSLAGSDNKARIDLQAAPRKEDYRPRRRSSRSSMVSA